MTSLMERECVCVPREHVQQFAFRKTGVYVCVCEHLNACCYTQDVNSPCFQDNICRQEESGWVLH